MADRARLDAGRGDAGLSVVLAIQIAIIFVVAPLAATATASADLVEMLRLGLAATMILIVVRRPIVQVVVALAFVGTIVATLRWRLGQTADEIAAIKVALALGFDIVVATIVAFVAFGPGKVTIHRILGAVILYLYVALVFAGIYRLMALTLGGAFADLPPDPRARFSGLLYFSLSTLTTAGSGEIMPLHPFVRSISSFEAVIGQLFPATLLARLVTLHATESIKD